MSAFATAASLGQSSNTRGNHPPSQGRDAWADGIEGASATLAEKRCIDLS